MHERVHIVRLVVLQDGQWSVYAVGDTIAIEKFVSRIVVRSNRRIKTINASRCNENSTIW